MPRDLKPDALRTAIANEIAKIKAYNVPGECVRLGLADGEEADAYRSKFHYALGRLQVLDLPRLVNVALRILDDRDAPELEEMIKSLGARGVGGDFKNLIFAADGPKPELVFVDAVNNDVKITKNAECCLVFSKPLPASGLSWRDLVAWWRDQSASLRDEAEVKVGQILYRRLFVSLASEPERLLFREYCSLYKLTGGFDLPALVPQVYLHYDPQVTKYRTEPAPLARQRMDFLLLLPRRERIVIEVDGIEHYSVEDRSNAEEPAKRRPSPQTYSEMVAEDRRLRLTGYEVFRFGGHELNGPRASELVLSFFRQLFEQRGIPLPTA